MDDSFVAKRRARWTELETLLQSGAKSGEDWSKLASLYRDLCADVAHSETLAVGPDVRAYLHDLAGRAHHAVYGSRALGGIRPAELLFRDFPRALRRNMILFVLASILFYGSFAVGFVGASTESNFASAVLGDSALAEMESMYSDDTSDRGSGGDAAMAGFYVYNNVGIALRCFATGALFGLGPLYILVYNGLTIGVVAGHLTHVGLGENLLRFVAGHSPWELTGVVVSGTAGLRLGLALISTGGLTRRASLRAASADLMHLVAGATGLLLVAAAIEGFFSAGPAGLWIRVGFGLLGCGIVAAWLLLGGRR